MGLAGGALGQYCTSTRWIPYILHTNIDIYGKIWSIEGINILGSITVLELISSFWAQNPELAAQLQPALLRCQSLDYLGHGFKAHRVEEGLAHRASLTLKTLIRFLIPTFSWSSLYRVQIWVDWADICYRIPLNMCYHCLDCLSRRYTVGILY